MDNIGCSSPTLMNIILDSVVTVEPQVGFFCDLIVKPDPVFMYEYECLCMNVDECGCERQKQEEFARHRVYVSENDFEEWKMNVLNFINEFCPYVRYGGDCVNNMLFISPHFYIIHKDWIEQQWCNIASQEECEAVLSRSCLATSGDVESNPGPQASQHFTCNTEKERSLREKIEAFERHRQRQTEKRKTVRRNIQIARKETKKFVFQMNADLGEVLSNPGVMRAAGYAAANFVAPGVGTAAATVVEGGKVLNATDKIREAANRLAESCTQQIPSLLQTHTNLADIASATLSNINTLTTKLQGEGGLLGTINKLVTSVTTSVSAISLLITVIMCIAALAWDWKIGCAVIFLVLVYFNWPNNVVEKIKQIIGKTGWSWELNVGDHIPLIGQVVFTLLAFFGVSKIPADRFYDNLLKRMDSIPKAFSGMSKIWDQAGKMFDLVSDEFKIYFLGAKREELLLEKGMTDEVSAWTERVKFYLDAKQKNLLARDEASVREVEQLFTQMYRWKHTPHLWKAMSSECQRVITSATPLVNDLYKFACRSTVHEGGPRKAPLAVFLSGDSGRGKSEMLYPLAFSLLAHRGYNMENARNEIYVRNYETEYWDGYVGQKIAFFDDAFQTKDSPGNPSPEFMEAIRLINTAPAHVHCADLNDKGRFFSSEICIYTTNLKEKFSSYINSINCPEAAMRRLNANAYRIKTNPDFEKKVKINGKEENRLDVEKIKKCEKCEKIRIDKGLERKLKFCPHVQLFDKYDLITDNILEKDLTYSQLVKQLKEYDSALVNEEEDKLYMYEKLITEPYIFEMNDAEEFHESSDSLGKGPIDFASATDTLAFNTLVGFTTYLTKDKPEGLGIVDQDMIESELAAHPDLWSTFQRLNKCGKINEDKRNDSLQIACDSAGIAYNHDAQIYHSTRNLSYNFKNVYNSFKGYVKKICEQIKYVWDNSGLGELISFVYLGLVFLALSSLAYKSFTSYMCPVCKKDECECIRIVDDGYLYKGTVYKYDDYQAETNAYEHQPRTVKTRLESDVRPLVNKPVVMRVESDVRPLVNQQPAMRVESDVRPLVNQQQALRVESVAVNAVETQEKIVQSESNILISGQPRSNNMKVEMYLDQGCEMLENKVLANSLYLLHDDVKPLGNVLFIRGTCFLINHHYIEILGATKPRDYTMYLTNRSQRMAEITLGNVLDHYVRLEKNGEKLDAGIVYLNPREDKIMPHVNLEKLFIETNDLSMLTGKYWAQLPTYNSQINNVVQSKRSLQDVKMSQNKIIIDDENVQMELNHTWQYYGMTSAGDCGAPIILNNNHAMRKIVGIHMASNGAIGLAQTITQESLRQAFAKIPFQYQNYVEIDLPCETIVTDERVCGSVPLDAGLMVHGKTDLPLSSGNTSKIMPSALYGITQPKTMPAKLKPFAGVDPMYNGLIKYGKNVPRINPKLIEIAVNDVKNNFVLNECHRDMNDYRRVLSYEESVLGVPGDDFLAPINRSTSMGYPYTAKQKLRGKRDAFGEDEWDFNSDLAKQVKKDVDTLIENCRKGIQTGVYWSDTLKDERRPIEKVMAGKTRVFCGGPVHFTLAFRQYFLGFAAWMMYNRNANEVSVGTNVYSPDWNEIVRKLASRAATKLGIRVVAGDFSNFDGSLSSQILWAILDAINEWYDDGEENFQIRRTLWMHIVHAIHINRDVIYQATHSQPSGCPITAILNSIYNSVIIRIAYLICAEEHYRECEEDFRSMKWFNLFVAMVSYGDDNLIGINERILGWFNQISITKALLVIGHEYTDEAKTGVIVPVRDISEVAYLKRSFVYNPMLNRYVAPLDLDTVLEIVQWTKKGLASDAITLANLDVTMRELALHDPSVFDKYKKLLYDQCAQKGIQYRFATQNEYLSAVCDEPLLLELNRGYVLQKTDKTLPKNYILHDKHSRTLWVNDYEEDVIKHKLALFCHYRQITVRHVHGLPSSLIEFQNCV